jgi:hypothetical protein
VSAAAAVDCDCNCDCDRSLTAGEAAFSISVGSLCVLQLQGKEGADWSPLF